MRTLRLIKRLWSEWPQPARRHMWLFWISLAAFFVFGLATRIFWIVPIGTVVSGVFAFLFGRCVFRDINGAATFWSNAYKESKGIPPDYFSFFDVPTAKFMGFLYMLMGIFWTGGSLVALAQASFAGTF